MARTDEGPSDAELVRAACAGDRASFGRLVDRYVHDVYAVAVRIICDRTEAEDVAQDTFIRAFERLRQYRMEHAFRTWLLKIATNTAINRLRSRRNQRRLHLRLARDEDPTRDESNSAEEVPSRQDWQRWLSQLDESPRAAIVLFHFQAVSYAEIAEILEMPINTVRTHIHRGRRRLRELITGESAREHRSWNAAM